MSHLGRPDGMRVERLSLRPVANELESLLGRPVLFLDECVGERVQEACADPPAGAIVLLENLRFHLEEEGKVTSKDGTKKQASPEEIAQFRRQLSQLGDIYINDAFGAAHRAHSSISGIDLPIRAAGLLLSKELTSFSHLLDDPNGIDLAILGGAKVSDKILLIENLLNKVHTLAIEGGMAFTFLAKVRGMSIGRSLYDEHGASLVEEIMNKAKERGVRILLPVDFITGSDLSDAAKVGEVGVNDEGIPDDMMGLDIGPASRAALVEAIKSSKTILWNGPVGVFEVSHFSEGTKILVNALMEATTERETVTIVGGGDSGAAVAKFGKEEAFSHVSTGGGASLELLEGKALPGITSLSDH